MNPCLHAPGEILAVSSSAANKRIYGRYIGRIFAITVLLLLASSVLVYGVSDGVDSRVSTNNSVPNEIDSESNSLSGNMSYGTYVTEVTLNKKEMLLGINETQTLKATVLPADAPNKSVWWGSYNKKVATVDDEGNVTGVSEGTTVIEVTTVDGGLTAQCTVTVSDVHVTSITVDPTTKTADAKSTFVITAHIMPENASDKAVTWTSSNTSVATVDSNGKVTTKAAGNAIIKATTHDGGLTASCTLTVKNVPVQSVAIEKSTYVVEKGESVKLKAVITPSNATIQTVTWSSSDPSVATVDASGNVKGLKLGTAIITVKTTDGGHTNSATVTVQNSHPVSVSLSAETLTLSGVAYIKDETELVQQIDKICQEDGNYVFLTVTADIGVVEFNTQVFRALSQNGQGSLTILVPDVRMTIPAEPLSELMFGTGKALFNLSHVDPPKGYKYKMQDAYNILVSDGLNKQTITFSKQIMVIYLYHQPAPGENIANTKVGLETSSGISPVSATYMDNALSFFVPQTGTYVIYNTDVLTGSFNAWYGIIMLIVALMVGAVIVVRYLLVVK